MSLVSEPTVSDIIVDIRGVLTQWQPRKTLEDLYPDGVIDMFFDSGDEWGFAYYDAMASSGWTEERVLSDYETHHGPAVAWLMRLFFEYQRLAVPGAVPGVEEKLSELHQRGVRIWGIANCSNSYMRLAEQQTQVLQRLSGIIYSAQEHLILPDVALLLRANQQFAIDSRHTVFVSADIRNVRAAKISGIRAIHFRSADDFNLMSQHPWEAK